MLKDFSYLEGLEENQYRIDVWIPDTTFIVLGRSKKSEEDVNSDTASHDMISIVRRVTGGGTVLIDNGCIIVDIGFRAKNRNTIIDFLHIGNEQIVHALKKLGIPAELDIQWPDIKISDKKICGSSLAIRKNLFLFSASLVYQSLTIVKMEKYLSLPKRQPPYRRGRNHVDFVISLDTCTIVSQSDLATYIRRSIESDLQLT